VLSAALLAVGAVRRAGFERGDVLPVLDELGCLAVDVEPRERLWKDAAVHQAPLRA